MIDDTLLAEVGHTLHGGIAGSCNYGEPLPVKEQQAAPVRARRPEEITDEDLDNALEASQREGLSVSEHLSSLARARKQ